MLPFVLRVFETVYLLPQKYRTTIEYTKQTNNQYITQNKNTPQQSYQNSPHSLHSIMLCLLFSDENGEQPVTSSTPRRATTTTTTTPPTATSASTTTDNITIEQYSTPLNTTTVTTPLSPQEPLDKPPATSTPHLPKDIDDNLELPVDTVDAAVSR